MEDTDNVGREDEKEMVEAALSGIEERDDLILMDDVDT